MNRKRVSDFSFLFLFFLISLIMPMYRLSAKALIYNEEQKFLLIKEAKGIRDFPGGGIEYGETPQEAIKRELSEEIGITANIEINTKITHFIAYYYQEKEVGVWLAFYEVSLPPKIEIQKGDRECVDYGYFSTEEAKELPLHQNVLHFLENKKSN